MDEQYCKNIYYKKAQDDRGKKKGRRSSACSRGTSQMNRHISQMLRRRNKSTGWASSSPPKLVRNPYPQESKEQEEVTEKKNPHILWTQTALALHGNKVCPKHLLQLG